MCCVESASTGVAASGPFFRQLGSKKRNQTFKSIYRDKEIQKEPFFVISTQKVSRRVWLHEKREKNASHVARPLHYNKD